MFNFLCKEFNKDFQKKMLCQYKNPNFPKQLILTYSGIWRSVYIFQKCSNKNTMKFYTIVQLGIGLAIVLIIFYMYSTRQITKLDNVQVETEQSKYNNDFNDEQIIFKKYTIYSIEVNETIKYVFFKE